MKEDEMPHLAITRDGKEVPLASFVTRVLSEAACAAPAVLHAANPLGELKGVSWELFSSQEYGRQPAVVATMDGSLFRSALAFLCSSIIGIPPYVGAKEFLLKVGEKTYQCVGMVQNTPGCNWVSITITEKSQQSPACDSSARADAELGMPEK
jgi:hypothetical protein